MQIAALEKASPGYMPYFYLQDADYLMLKKRICQHILRGPGGPGGPGGPKGVATLDIGIDTLELAEYLTPLLKKQLLG